MQFGTQLQFDSRNIIEILPSSLQKMTHGRHKTAVKHPDDHLNNPTETGNLDSLLRRWSADGHKLSLKPPGEKFTQSYI